MVSALSGSTSTSRPTPSRANCSITMLPVPELPMTATDRSPQLGGHPATESGRRAPDPKGTRARNRGPRAPERHVVAGHADHVERLEFALIADRAPEHGAVGHHHHAGMWDRMIDEGVGCRRKEPCRFCRPPRRSGDSRRGGCETSRRSIPRPSSDRDTRPAIRPAN